MEFHKNHKMSITKLNKFLMASWQLKSHFQSKSYSVDKLAQKYMFLSQKNSIFGLNSIKLFEKTRSAQKCILTTAGAGERRIGDGETNPWNCLFNLHPAASWSFSNWRDTYNFSQRCLREIYFGISWLFCCLRECPEGIDRLCNIHTFYGGECWQ